MTDENRSKEYLERELKQLRNRLAKLEEESIGPPGAISGASWKRLVNAAPVGVYITLDSDFVYTNPTMSKLTGYSSDELKSMKPWDLVHPEMRDLAEQRGLARARGEVVEQRYAIHCQNKIGDSIWIDFFAENVEIAGKAAILGTAVDITDRTLAEGKLVESEKRFRSLFENSQTGMFRSTLDGQKILAVNQKIADIWGGSIEETLQTGPFDNWNCPEDRERFVQLLKRDGIVTDFEAQMTSPTGTTVYVLISAQFRPEENVIDGSVIDITGRKLAENALRESEQFDRAVTENSPVGISVRSRHGKLLSVNQAWRDFWEIPDETVREYMAANPDELRLDHKDSYLGEWQSEVVKVYRDGGTLRVPEIRVDNHRSGEPRWISHIFYAILDESGQVDRVVILTNDITERKKAEEALNESRRSLAEAQSIALLGSWDWDIIGDKISWSDETFRQMGLRPGEITPTYEAFEKFVHPDSRELVDNAVKQALGGKDSYSVEAKMVRADGTEWVMYARGKVSRDEDDSPVRFVGTQQDITDRKLAEQALRQSEETARALLNAPTDILFLIDSEGIIETVNEAAATRFGRTPSELIGANVYDLLPPEVSKLRKAKGKQVFETGQPLRFTDNRDGRFYDSHVYPVVGDDGSVRSIAVYSHDVTDRNKAEDALLASQANLLSILESTDDFILLADQEGKPVFFNAAYANVMKELLGIDMKPGLSPHSLLPDPAERAVWDDNHRRVLSGERFVFEHKFVDPEGVTHHFETTFNPILEGTEVTGFSEFTHEVTRRKLAEIALHTSQAELSSIIENTEDVILLCDHEGRILFFNKVFERVMSEILGVEVKVGLQATTVLPAGKQREEWDECHRRVLAGERFIHDHSWEIPGEPTRHFETSFNPIFEGDAIRGFSEFTREVTDRKRAENEIRASQANILSILENTDDLIMLCDKNSRIVYMNSAFHQSVKDLIDVDIVPGVNLNDLMPQEDGQAWQGLYYRALAGENFLYEFSWVAVDGKTRSFETRFNPIRSGNEVQGFSQFTHEVTERKEAEAAIKESEDKFRSIAERSFDVIFIADLDGNLSFASPASRTVLGYDPGEMVGRNISEFVTSNSLTDVARGFAENAQGRSIEGVQFEMIGADGKVVHVEVNARAVVQDGRVIGSQATIRDISLRKRAEEMLEQAFNEQSRQLRQVAGGLAHDVYNDLFPVAAAIHKLRKRMKASSKPTQERDTRLLNLMDRAVRRAIDLTESVNLYSKLDRSEIAEGANLASTIGEVMDQNRVRVAELGISVEIQVPDTIDVACPHIQVFHLFNNLMLNAFDATKDSSTKLILVSASLEDEQVRIEFKDSGQGIPPETLPRIFEPFFSTRPKTGTGLGLAIVKRIIDLSSGNIEVKSSLDKGTTFTIILPGNVGTKK